MLAEGPRTDLVAFDGTLKYIDVLKLGEMEMEMAVALLGDTRIFGSCNGSVGKIGDHFPKPVME